MKTAVKRVLIFGLMCVLGLSLAAQDAEPNDPRVNERANACYDGGTLEGKCQIEEEWKAGWYLIRVEYGIFAQDDVPQSYQWLFPDEEEEPEEESRYRLCFSTPVDAAGGASAALVGPINTKDNARSFPIVGCQGDYMNVATMVRADTYEQAVALCKQLEGDEYTAYGFEGLGYEAPPDYYGCSFENAILQENG